MDYFFDINWISFFVLSIFGIAFAFLKILSKKIKQVFVILISLVLGIGLGFIFKSSDNSYLRWIALIGDIYVNAIKALVAPIILISVFSSFVQLRSKKKMQTIGIKSVVWLLVSASLAIVLSIVIGTTLKIGKGAGAIFEKMSGVSESTTSAYQGLTKTIDEVIVNLFPSNIVSDFASNNVVAIIILAIAFAIGYIMVASSEGEANIKVFKNVVLAAKKILFKILEFIISLTPYAVLCLVSVSAGTIFSDLASLSQLLLLVGIIYGVAIIHTYFVNGLLIKLVAKLKPVKFFRDTFDAQATAFATQSSVGTLPVTTQTLVKNVGVSEEVANFTAPLGTTIGMPGCTCIWPVLLALFYINASGIVWGPADYILLAIMTLLFSLGSAGVPGIAIVSAIGLFSALNLPVAAVILFMPINAISDMIRTLDNVSTATVASAIVAQKVKQISTEGTGQEIEKITIEKDNSSSGCCGSTFLDEDTDSDETVITLEEE